MVEMVLGGCKLLFAAEGSEGRFVPIESVARPSRPALDANDQVVITGEGKVDRRKVKRLLRRLRGGR